MKKVAYKDLILMVLGLALMSFGYAAFILPENIVTGGVAGISSIIYFATNHGINIAIPNYLINVLLLVIAYRTVGKSFVVRTIIGATIFNILLGILTPLFTHPIVNGQPFMSVIIGAVFGGVGLGITYTHNGSSGGTDVVAAMVSKHSNVSFGRVMMYCDLIIISSSLVFVLAIHIFSPNFQGQCIHALPLFATKAVIQLGTKLMVHIFAHVAVIAANSTPINYLK